MMIFTKLQLGLTATATGALVAAGAWQIQQNAHLRAEIARTTALSAAAETALEQKLEVETQRAAAADKKVAHLLQAAQNAGVRRPKLASVVAPLDTEEFVQEVTARATQLVKEGRPREAIDEYVKAYQELHRIRPGSSQCQRIMGALQYLGRTQPDARAALSSLRDASVAERRKEPNRSELVFEIALMNDRLGEGHLTLSLFDSLAADDRSRQSLAMIAFNSFVQARRYEDALRGKSFGQMLTHLEAGAKHLPEVDPQRQASVRTSLIETALQHIEVLAGAGKRDDARLLTEKLLAFDNSPATAGALQRRLAPFGGK